jgi:hypothetical protein
LNICRNGPGGLARRLVVVVLSAVTMSLSSPSCTGKSALRCVSNVACEGYELINYLVVIIKVLGLLPCCLLCSLIVVVSLALSILHRLPWRGRRAHWRRITVHCAGLSRESRIGDEPVATRARCSQVKVDDLVRTGHMSATR